MNVEVELPDLGDEAGDEARVSEWHCEEGDLVEQDEPLVEVVAGDFTIDVPSPASGVLIERLALEEDVVRVGDPLALIEVEEDYESVFEQDFEDDEE